MILNRKFILKCWLISFALAFATVIADKSLAIPELTLALRLAGVAFFLFLFHKVLGMIKIQDKMIKDSHGFAERLFDPWYLKVTLFLFIVGWAAYAIGDYLQLDSVDWITIFSIGVVIFPIASGLIPLRVKKEKWRR